MLIYNINEGDGGMHQRHKKILDMLQAGKLLIKEAAVELGVTEMTLRRDLKELESKKMVLLVKGGAVPHPARYEPEQTETELLGRKFAIAKALFLRILPTDTIFISTGSTSLAFAKVIARQNVLPMTVVTNSLSVASTLFRSCCKVILLGGELRTNSLDLVGPISEKNIEEYHVDWLISGCDGAFSDYGFYTSDISLLNLEKKSIGIADHVAVIADSTKFGRKALTRFAALKDIDLLVTDNGLSDDDYKKLRKAAIEVIKVELEISE